MLWIRQICVHRVQLTRIRPLLLHCKAEHVLSTNAKTLKSTRSRQSRLVTCVRQCSSYKHNPKVPEAPTWEPPREDQLPPSPQVPADLVDKLERLALVDFRTQEGLACLQSAIRFADQLHVVDASGVEPMHSVLDHGQLFLRDDTVTEGECAETLLQLSNTTVEDYFVAPPGNIPLPKREEKELPC